MLFLGEALLLAPLHCLLDLHLLLPLRLELLLALGELSLLARDAVAHVLATVHDLGLKRLELRLQPLRLLCLLLQPHLLLLERAPVAVHLGVARLVLTQQPLALTFGLAPHL